MKPVVPMHMRIREMLRCQSFLTITAMWPEHNWEARRDWFQCKACGEVIVVAHLDPENQQNMEMNGWNLVAGCFWRHDDFKQSCAETITNDVHET